MKTMVPVGPPVQTVHHSDQVYKAGPNGEFHVLDHHVGALHAHGLVLKEDVEAKARLIAAEVDVLAQAEEIQALKARLAALEAPKALEAPLKK